MHLECNSLNISAFPSDLPSSIPFAIPSAAPLSSASFLASSNCSEMLLRMSLRVMILSSYFKRCSTVNSPSYPAEIRII